MRTYDEILAGMKSQVSNLDTQAGSFVDTLLRGAADEVARGYVEQEGLVSIAFVDESSGVYIDKRAAEYGISRKAGTLATADVTFSGSDGSVVASGTAVQTQQGLVFTVMESQTVADGVAVCAVIASQAGDQYNVDADAINTMVNSGSLTIASATAATGGTDGESDSALLARLQALWRRPPTSGNVFQYESWAMEVEGVGGAKVAPSWDGGGTVKVVIVDGNMEPPTTDLVAQVATYIETVRPICVDVTVAGATGLEIDVAISGLDLTTGAVESQVLDTFADLVAQYLQSLAFVSDTVIYSRFGYLLLGISGVLDYSGLTINTGTSNLEIGAYEVPILGEVTAS